MYPTIMSGKPVKNSVRLSLFTSPDIKVMKRMSTPTRKRKTPNLLTMQVMINEMGETSNDRFSHS
jgi:hypothetical protein